MLDDSRDRPNRVNKVNTIYYVEMPMNPDPKFRQMRAFVTAMESTSFTLAAQKMEISQPSFSALIRDLESSLQAKLFERTTRRCVPTDAAQALYEQVKSPLRQIELAYRNARDIGNGVGGRLRLAALPSMASGAITRKLAEFQRAQPDITITLVERRHDQQREAVLKGEVEFGVCTLGEPHPELSFQSLYTDRLMIVAPADHPLVGDVRHGSGQINRHYRENYDLHRLALHAARVAFDHPVTGVRIDVTAEIPPDFAEPLAKLGLPTEVAK